MHPMLEDSAAMLVVESGRLDLACDWGKYDSTQEGAKL